MAEDTDYIRSKVQEQHAVDSALAPHHFTIGRKNSSVGGAASGGSGFGSGFSAAQRDVSGGSSISYGSNVSTSPKPPAASMYNDYPAPPAFPPPSSPAPPPPVSPGSNSFKKSNPYDDDEPGPNDTVEDI
jgi:hypothetical protein